MDYRQRFNQKKVDFSSKKFIDDAQRLIDEDDERSGKKEKKIDFLENHINEAIQKRFK